MDPTDVSGNNLLNMLVNQVDKLTIGLMSLFNVNQTSIDTVKQAFIDKQNNVANADQKLDDAFSKYGWIKYLLYVALGLIGLRLITQFIQAIRR
jgi:hypothetical protein